jgi:hypothetical protein
MNPKSQYHVHKIQPLAHILSQINPVNKLPSSFLKTNLNIIFQTTPWSSRHLFVPQFATKASYALLSHVCHTHRRPHPCAFYHIINTHKKSETWSSLAWIFPSPILFLPLSFKHSPQHPVLKRPSKQKANVSFSTFQCLHIYIADSKTNILSRIAGRIFPNYVFHLQVQRQYYHHTFHSAVCNIFDLSMY